MHSPRVLTIAFELHVPEGLRRDIRGQRLEQAVARITGAVQGLVPAVFPWADRVVVRTAWDYRWWEDTETISMPPTDDNTVDSPTTAEEEAALVVGQ